MILNDQQIKLQEGMIVPFLPHLVREEGKRKVVSYGLSSFGYDIRLDDVLWLAGTMDNPPLRSGAGAPVIDPKRMDQPSFQWKPVHVFFNMEGDAYVDIPAHGFALGSSVEKFRMPHDIVGVCVGKSTYARCGLIVNVTPLEPGWTGHLTLELHNTTDLSVRVYLREGIAQIMFHQGMRPDTTYDMREGKYQNQPAHPVFARV